MKKVKLIVILGSMVLLSLGVAKGDWVPADDHKMHWPQEPDPDGWDVMATEPYILADDFECAETGYILDIHFWGSWRGGYDPPWTTLYGFWISIHTDIPDPDPGNPLTYSMPGPPLLNKFYPIEDFIVAGPFPGDQGWYDPASGLPYVPSDHFEYYQYNLFLPEENWIFQDAGNIYWLNISAMVDDPIFYPWGWKTTLPALRFLDTSVWADQFTYPDLWFPIYDPIIGEPEHLDLAFVITGEPEDADDDGIPFPQDNCPNHPNPLQEDSYPPCGNDIGDACDCEGDFDCDRDVDAADLSTFMLDVTRTDCTDLTPCNGDFDCDGDVGPDDLLLFQADWLRPDCPPCNVGTWCSYQGCPCTGDPDCDDGTYCNGAETCNLSTNFCEDATPVVCMDGLYCNGLETCNEANDSCDSGTPLDCGDGTYCNGDETCNETNDSCNPGTSINCDDGTYCNGVETCNETNDSCDPGTLVDCDDATYCNGVETCNETNDNCDAGTDPCPPNTSCNETTHICDLINDADGDGIPDEEDNCPTVPNGPSGGTCVHGGTGAVGGTCMNDGECGAGEFCSMNQEDRDFDGTGDACDSCTGCLGDFDGDGDVDGSDAFKFKTNFGRSNCPACG